MSRSALILCLTMATTFLPPSSQPLAADEPVELLRLPNSGADPARISYDELPRLAGEHAVVSPADPVLKFQLHSYLVHYDGRYWCMWSQGPPVEDEPSQEVRFSTSADGLQWGPAQSLTGAPRDGYAFIARGFWVRDGELLALAAHFKGKGAFGVDKELELRVYRWQPESGWTRTANLYDDAINNFAPQKLPDNHWIVTRRDARFNVSVLIGGRESLTEWTSWPVVGRRDVAGFSPDEPILWPLDDGRLFAVFRDNGGSQRLFHAESRDSGRTWTRPAITNFPNATSKLYSLLLSTGDRVLASNANPNVGRRELHLSVSRDGQVFTRMAKLEIPSPRPATLQYPHMIEREGQLLIAFSRNKNTIELLRVPVASIAGLLAEDDNASR